MKQVYVRAYICAVHLALAQSLSVVWFNSANLINFLLSDMEPANVLLKNYALFYLKFVTLLLFYPIFFLEHMIVPRKWRSLSPANYKT